ncbi:hypothetical protein DPMN_001835 [Dreissena polymorpha]|uniref:RFX1-4/6/8-like BCD domain-containing protein n=1 Tax=Dreissena polymorpha TaxID=45954 RepID=A0A9D4MKH8_DREPO|nr:hypothetical protein DPMN_001835 [Dreissena polymorpha]
MNLETPLLFPVARSFAQVLKRQTSLNHLCQAARTVVNSADITAQMLDDWFNIDLNSIIKQTLYTADRNTDQDSVNIVKRKYQSMYRVMSRATKLVESRTVLGHPNIYIAVAYLSW